MSVINRRNAVMGWAVWTVVKRVGKRKAPNKLLIAVMLAAVAGVFALVIGRRAATD